MITPDEAHELIGSNTLPVPVAEVFKTLGYSLEPNANLKRPAVSWPHLRVVRFRPARSEVKREALAHELGHCCSEDPGWGRFCEVRAWESQRWYEREAHRWAEDFLMPLDLIKLWIVDLGPGLRLSILAEMCQVSVAFARRRLRHADLERFVWDDVAPGGQQLTLPARLTAP